MPVYLHTVGERTAKASLGVGFAKTVREAMDRMRGPASSFGGEGRFAVVGEQQQMRVHRAGDVLKVFSPSVESIAGVGRPKTNWIVDGIYKLVGGQWVGQPRSVERPKAPAALARAFSADRMID